MYRAIIKLTMVLSVCILTGCSGFYVKIVDQYGDPVPDVDMVLSVPSGFAWGGGRTKHHHSDKRGRFKLDSPGSVFYYISKNGYEFTWDEGAGSADILGHYTKQLQKNSYEHPYFIMAWKRREPEPLIGGGDVVTLTPDKYFHPIEFSNEGLVLKKWINVDTSAKSNAILLIGFEEFGEIVHISNPEKELRSWKLTLLVPQGGLIETDDLFQNLAPDSGYQQQWSIDSNDLGRVDALFKRKFYVKSRNGQVYGRFTVDFNSRYRKSTSIRIEPYWFNMNGSRNLTRPKSYAYCQGRMTEFKECSLDDYGP